MVRCKRNINAMQREYQCDANGISSKTADIFKDQNLHVEEALKLVTLDDTAELGLTKDQNKLLSKAVSKLKASDLPPKLAEPNTATSLAKDQGLDEILKKLE